MRNPWVPPLAAEKKAQSTGLLLKAGLLNMIPAPGTPMMRVLAYVNVNTRSTHPPLVGDYVKLTVVLGMRPTDHQYAVVETDDLFVERQQGLILGIDLYGLEVSTQGQVMHLGPHREYPSKDVAIMSIMMRGGLGLTKA
jgi:hypothetical protein